MKAWGILRLYQAIAQIIFTKQSTFNFQALEVTDFVESKLLQYFCKTNCVHDRL